jgi:hypothetical protein
MAEKISIEIALEGGAEIERQLAEIGDAGQQAFKQIQDAAEATTFEAATQSIAKLGSTAEEALSGAAKAAEKFGASANQLTAVETRIKAIAARARDGSLSFAELARNYDAARTSAAALSEASATAAAAVAGVTKNIALTRTEIAGLKTALREVGLGQVAQQFTPFLTLGARIGAVAAGITAVGAALAGAIKVAIDFANSLNAINAAAAKAGLSVQAYDELSKALQAAGVSGKGSGAILQRLGEAAETAKIDQVTKAFNEFRDASQRGFGPVGVQQIALLEERAKGLTESAKLARKYLVELGVPIPTDAPKTLAELVAETGDAKAGLVAFVQQLQRMPDGLERTQFALDQLKDSGLELIDALKTGSIEQFFAKLKQGSQVTEEQLIAAARYRQSISQMSAAWEEFKATMIVPVATPLLQGIMETGPAVLAAFRDVGQALLPIVQIAASVGQSFGTAFQVAGQAVATLLQGFAPLGQALTDLGSVAASIGQSFVQGFALIGAAITKAGEALASFAATVAGFVWGPIEAGIALWNSMTGAIQAAIDKLTKFISLLPGGAGGPKLGEAGGVQIGGAARGGLIGGRGTGTSDSNLAWLSRGEYVINAAAVRQFGTGLFAALNGGRIPGFQAGGLVAGAAPAVAGPLQKIDQIAQQTARIDANVNTVINMLNDIGSRITDIGNGVIRLAEGVAQLINWAAVLSQQQAELGRAVQQAAKGQAGGGLIGGRGTGTSDSNLAWLSRGEFVINAASVRRFGAQFFAMLNAGMMPGFALGGMVPAFAGGGSVGPHLGTLELALPSGMKIAVRASSSAVEELRREAALAQVRSGGRKPSRYS